MAGIIEFKEAEVSLEYIKQVGVEYRFDCYKNKVADGCHRLADFLEAFEKDVIKARTVYEMNCNENSHAHSCLKIANFELLGKGGPKDMKSAYNHYTTACEKGSSAACTNGSLMHDAGKVEPNDFRASVKLLETGCDTLNDTACCQQLSTYYIAGKPGVCADFGRAFSYAERACVGGHMYACANLAQMYKRGDGVEKSLDKFEYYKKRAKRLHKEATQPDVEEIKMGQ